MANALPENNLEFHFRNDKGRQYLEVISGELTTIVDGSATPNKIIDQPAIQTAINETIQDLSGGLSLHVETADVKMHSSKTVDLTATTVTHEYKSNVTEEFLTEISRLGGVAKITHVAFAQKFQDKLNAKITAKAPTMSGKLEVNLSNDFSPTEVSATIQPELFNLKTLVDNDYDKPAILFDSFIDKHFIALFKGSFNLGATRGGKGLMSTLNTLGPKTEYLNILKDFDSTLLTYIKYYLFILEDQVKNTVITEDDMYTYLSETVVQILGFRKEFIKGSGDDIAAKIPFDGLPDSKNLGEVLRYVQDSFSNKFDLSAGFNLVDGKFLDFRNSVNLRINIPDDVKNKPVKISKSKWSGEIDPIRILEVTDSKYKIRNDYLSDDSVEDSLNKFILQISNASATTGSAGLITTFIDYRKVIDSNVANKFDPKDIKKPFDKKIQDKFDANIVQMSGSNSKFVDPLINPFSTSFSASDFLNQMQTDHLVFEDFQAIILNLKKESSNKSIPPEVSKYYGDLYIELKTRLQQDKTGTLSILKDNLVAKIKSKVTLTIYEENQLKMIDEVNQLFTLADTGKELGFSSNSNLDAKQISASMQQFQTEFASISTQRKRELEIELRALKSSRGMTQVQRDDLEKRRVEIMTDIEKVNQRKEEVTTALKSAKKKVEEIFNLTQVIERNINKVEGSFERFKSMEALRNIVWGDLGDDEPRKLRRSGIAGLLGGLTGVSIGGGALATTTSVVPGVGLIPGVLGLSHGLITTVVATNPILAFAAVGLTIGGGVLAGRYFGGKAGDARAEFYRNQVNEADTNRMQTIKDLYKQDDTVTAAQNKVTDMVRMFKYYESKKGPLSSAEKYSMLIDIWDNYKTEIKKVDSASDGNLVDFVDNVADKIQAPHTAYRTYTKELGGFNAGKRDDYIAVKEKYNKAHANRATQWGWFKNKFAPRTQGGNVGYNPLGPLFKFIFG